jgi:hypothetical protein
MPAKKTVTLATPCTKTGHKRIVYIDAKTQKTSYPCRKVAKARVGPSTKCPFTGEERKLVKVTSKKTGKVSEVWRCAPKYTKGTPTIHTPCKKTTQHRVQVVRKAKNGSSKTVFTCRTPPMGRPCKAGMSRVKVTRTLKNGSTKPSYVCRKSATKANRPCPKPGQVRRPVMVSGKKVMRCRAILKRGEMTNTYKPMYKMFETRKPRKARVPLYMNAAPTMTDIVNASDASLIRVLTPPKPRSATPKPRKPAAKRARSATPATGPRRSKRIASR